MLAENRSGPGERCSDRDFLENLSVAFSANELISGKSSSSTLKRQRANSPSHSLGKKIRLIACKISGQVSCRRMFLTKQQTLLCNHGQKPQLNNTVPTSERG